MFPVLKSLTHLTQAHVSCVRAAVSSLSYCRDSILFFALYAAQCVISIQVYINNFICIAALKQDLQSTLTIRN